MHKVSFILPAYKRRFLKDAIASILTQTYRDFELVVVDDCSPENLKDIVDQFKDERISYKRHEVNLGGNDLVAAWEYAMRFATADWCVLASDDDVYHPRFLEEMMCLQGRYPTADLFHARQVLIDDVGRVLKIGEPRREMESAIEMAYNRSILRLRQTAPEFVFRLSAFKAYGGFVRFPLAWFSDDATWMRLAQNGVGCSQEPLFSFRYSGMNITSKTCDVPVKILAGELFKVWFSDFMMSLTPDNEMESDMKRLAMEKIGEVVDSVAKMYMDGLPVLDWVRCYRMLSGDSGSRRSFLYERFPLLAGLRRLI